MARSRVLYNSRNGDRSLLTRGAEPEGDLFVRHEPNAASGGAVSDTAIAEFLIRGSRGPEHAALLRLIGTLVGDH